MKNSSITRRSLAVMLLTLLTLVPVAARAQCDASTEERLAFLETRLDEGEFRNKLWWRSWLAVFSIGFASGVGSAIMHDDESNKADAGITAAKSMFGIFDLTIRPHVSRHGADKIRDMPKSSPEACAARLRFAESTMQQAAKEASTRWDWKRHLWSLTLNLAHGLVIAEAWHDEGTGWQSFAVSEVSSEAFIWTHPTRARYDWRDYQTQYGAGPIGDRTSQLYFAPKPGGVAVVWRF
jgi:hypothetical protein